MRCCAVEPEVQFPAAAATFLVEVVVKTFELERKEKGKWLVSHVQEAAASRRRFQRHKMKMSVFKIWGHVRFPNGQNLEPFTVAHLVACIPSGPLNLLIIHPRLYMVLHCLKTVNLT